MAGGSGICSSILCSSLFLIGLKGFLLRCLEVFNFRELQGKFFAFLFVILKWITFDQILMFLFRVGFLRYKQINLWDEIDDIAVKVYMAAPRRGEVDDLFQYGCRKKILSGFRSWG